eukprot:9106496-Pyramimonas_sp.AAC.1
MWVDVIKGGYNWYSGERYTAKNSYNWKTTVRLEVPVEAEDSETEPNEDATAGETSPIPSLGMQERSTRVSSPRFMHMRLAEYESAPEVELEKPR